jgi:hypothetical protein
MGKTETETGAILSFYPLPITALPLACERQFVVGLRPAKTIKHARQPVT